MRNEVRIEVVQNGFMVRLEDMEVVKKNMKSDGVFESPDKDFIFPTKEETMTFVSKALDDVVAAKSDTDDEFSKTFKELNSSKG